MCVTLGRNKSDLGHREHECNQCRLLRHGRVQGQSAPRRHASRRGRTLRWRPLCGQEVGIVRLFASISEFAQHTRQCTHLSGVSFFRFPFVLFALSCSVSASLFRRFIYSLTSFVSSLREYRLLLRQSSLYFPLVLSRVYWCSSESYCLGKSRCRIHQRNI